MESKKIVKINIGSGPDGREDWINLDWGLLPLLGKISWLLKLFIKIRLIPKNYSIPWPKSLRLVDCRKKLPFKDNSVDYIYSSHFIEHLYYYQVINLIQECKRILRIGGILRISVPDLKLLSEKYVSGDKNFFLSLEDKADNREGLENIGDLFIQHVYGYNSWLKPSILGKIERLFIRGHLWMYDFESLLFILNKTGFINILRSEPGKGQTPDLNYLDIHRKTSLIIEASKN